MTDNSRRPNAKVGQSKAQRNINFRRRYAIPTTTSSKEGSQGRSHYNISDVTRKIRERTIYLIELNVNITVVDLL